MCVEWRGDWHESKEDIIAYKVVMRRPNTDKWVSITRPRLRMVQPGLPFLHEVSPYGKEREYFPDTVYWDREHFGFYMYESIEDAFNFMRCVDWYSLSPRVMQIKIPAGSMVRRGTDVEDRPTINATVIRTEKFLCNMDHKLYATREEADAAAARREEKISIRNRIQKLVFGG